jgi:hypothetical protein
LFTADQDASQERFSSEPHRRLVLSLTNEFNADGPVCKSRSLRFLSIVIDKLIKRSKMLFTGLFDWDSTCEISGE